MRGERRAGGRSARRGSGPARGGGVGRAAPWRAWAGRARGSLAHDLDAEGRALGQRRRQRLDQRLAAVVERGDAAAAGTWISASRAGDDRAGAQRAGQLDRGLDDLAVLDQDRAVLADPSS